MAKQTRSPQRSRSHQNEIAEPTALSGRGMAGSVCIFTRSVPRHSGRALVVMSLSYEGISQRMPNNWRSGHAACSVMLCLHLPSTLRRQVAHVHWRPSVSPWFFSDGLRDRIHTNLCLNSDPLAKTATKFCQPIRSMLGSAATSALFALPA